MVETGYAKDGVPVDRLPGEPQHLRDLDAPLPIRGSTVEWLVQLSRVGCPVTLQAGPYTGTALGNISNADNGGGASSTAYRVWCASDSSRITDWGALTNLGPNLEVQNVTLSNGAPDGHHLR